jgi:UDP-glucose 4-epimerase
MLEKCVELGVKKVVFISSGGTVYGRPAQLPIAETGATDPECSYGITKLTIEKYLALYHHLHGLDYVVVRPSNPFGSRQNPQGIQGAIPVFLGKVAKGESIEIWGDGEVVRDYLYIDDLVDGVYLAAMSESQDRIFNLGSGKGNSLNEIVGSIRTVTGVSVRVNYNPGRSFDVPKIWLDISRAGKQLGWAPKISLDDGMLRTWNFIRSL